MGQAYTGRNIQVLEGLEAVRKKPGMYIGGTAKPGLHHLLWEVVDNGVDEAANGHADRIEVVLHQDGKSVTVTDNGRGIPVDPHPEKKVPALQVIMTILHSGGKFDGDQYAISGGLHGVGVSVVNALSSKLVATVRRDGSTFQQQYERGEPVTRLLDLGRRTRETGTTIYFEPDPEIFDTIQFDADWIREELETKTYLYRGLKIVFTNEVDGRREEYLHEGGIEEYLEKLTKTGSATPVHTDVFTLIQETLQDGARLEIALQWTEASKECTKSFVNGIPTRNGGTHEQGFRNAVRIAVKTFLDTHNLIPRRTNLMSDDLREGLYAVISMFMVDPQFQGQTKDKLNNFSARSLVSSAVRTPLEHFLNTHPSSSEAIASRVLQATRARLASRAVRRAARPKYSLRRRLNLPGKLADCSSVDPQEGELFIVEGDSAGGSAKQGRDRKFQAVLPLRGKVLNAEQATTKRLLANAELSNVVQALGCGIGDALDVSRLRYHKVILLMDADFDGHHIATLLLTFFFRYMKPLIDHGHVFVAEPPLYRLDAGKEAFWALDDADKDRITRRLRRKNPRIKIDVQRFKGLGEMMPKTLKETTLDPESRHLLQITIPEESQAESMISSLMGKEPARRYRFIMENARFAEALDI